MQTLSKLAAIWVSRHGWHLSATNTQDAVACEIASDAWRTEPAWNDPARLLDWALALARTGHGQPPPVPGRTFHFERPADSDKTTRFALLLSPEACAAFGLGAPPDQGAEHPWRAALEAAGWTLRTRSIGPWLTVERPQAEIGILMAGWLDKTKPAELANHGVVLAANGHLDGWGSCFVHGEYRRLTGWPLSAGAGMAAVKGLWRTARRNGVTWAPKLETWARIPVLAAGRDQRPWHVQWTAPDTILPDPLPAGRVALWDANADYLVAWGIARFARGLPVHTGPDRGRPANGYWPAGWYLIDRIELHPRLAHIADRLPPIYGSRTPNQDGAVWVTHVILQLLDSLKHTGPDGAPIPAPTYRILDSYTAPESGQIARTWAEKLKAALLEARIQAAQDPGPETGALEAACKMSYARGYPLLEKAGFIRRPDHVDTLIDQRWFSAYRRMWSAAWNEGRFPLDVSADEVTYLYRDTDEEDGPLGKPDPMAYGHYKIKRRGTLQEWHSSHQDGRNGKWWLPAPGPLQQMAREANSALAEAALLPENGTGNWLDELLGE
jgi:hypothetical protein